MSPLKNQSHKDVFKKQSISILVSSPGTAAERKTCCSGGDRRALVGTDLWWNRLNLFGVQDRVNDRTIGQGHL